MLCIYFGISINGWRFTDGYIAAIRNLGLADSRLASYMLYVKIREGNRQTFCLKKKLLQI
jgi:hypothetical protein